MSKTTLPRKSKISVRSKSTADAVGNAAELHATPSDDQRRAMIAEGAYYRAERRGFAPGYEVDDWLAAEHELEMRIHGQALEHTTGELH